MTNVVDSMRQTVEQRPLSTALVDGNDELTYRELWIRASEFAGGLRKYDVRAGDTVPICLPNSTAFVVALLGTLRNGSVAVPINPRFETEEKSAITRQVGANVVVATDDQVTGILSNVDTLNALVRVGDGANLGVDFDAFTDTDGLYDFWEVIERADEDPALLSYTGTETPRKTGVVLSHEALRSNAEAVAEIVPGGLGPEDEQLSVLPATHLFNITPVLNATLLTGGRYNLIANPSAEATVDRLDAHDITVFHLSPSMYARLAADELLEAVDLSSLRVAGSVGGPFPPSAREMLSDAGCEKRYYFYGRTETGPVALVNVDGSNRSLGRPVPGGQARIVNPAFEECPVVEGDETVSSEACGELVVAGPNVADGYYDNDTLEDERFTLRGGDNWYHTGLTAYKDVDDYVYRVED
ncbi:class I adenylate-forming enzyme family protein [Natrialba sp. INN-245]|uniref:class I adenylate-forming enzyme family protein n=1 Tax=Natrialba sp. INN-245 TaxID=2690967 RepID=UPI00130FE9A5|nr:class I adenylate-forming enzyme family protein [Natrialba sp. INN-245]MWV39867.1 AMP-binding protein [Natrialba sp. INN-245]